MDSADVGMMVVTTVVRCGTCGSSRSVCLTLDGVVLRPRTLTYMSVHVVESPSLEGSSLVVSMLAIDLNHLVKDTTSPTEMLITMMISEDEKYLQVSEVP